MPTCICAFTCAFICRSAAEPGVMGAAAGGGGTGGAESSICCAGGSGGALVDPAGGADAAPGGTGVVSTTEGSLPDTNAAGMFCAAKPGDGAAFGPALVCVLACVLASAFICARPAFLSTAVVGDAVAETDEGPDSAEAPGFVLLTVSPVAAASAHGSGSRAV